MYLQVGVLFRYLESAKVKENDSIRLKREVDNEYDSNAIKVLNKKGKQVGYVSRIDTCKIKINDSDEIKGRVIKKTTPENGGNPLLIIYVHDKYIT